MMRRDAGLSLLELVVALGVFGLIAVMGSQTLTLALQRQDRLAGAERLAEELSLALTVLRRDLRGMAPVGMDEIDPPEGALHLFDRGLALTVAGQKEVSATRTRRIDWRITSDGLTRTRRGAVSPSLRLAAVKTLTVEIWTPQRGWHIPEAAPGASSALPDGIRVQLSHSVFGPITVVEALR